MLTHEEEIKVRLFQSIAGNADKLCDPKYYFTPVYAAKLVNDVYNELFNKPNEEKK